MVRVWRVSSQLLLDVLHSVHSCVAWPCSSSDSSSSVLALILQQQQQQQQHKAGRRNLRDLG